jgi:hypothetical protein
MASIPYSTFHLWARLPTELKLMVLSEHLRTHPSTAVTRAVHDELIKDRLTPLICAGNQELAELAKEACK